MTEAQTKHMVSRFLGWRLPENFSPDAGISFKKTFNEHTAHPMKHEPVGTNLFDATQAEAMVRYMIEGSPPSAAVKEEREACAKALEEALELLAELGPMISKMRTIAGDASAITGDIEATLVTIGYGGSALATEKEIK